MLVECQPTRGGGVLTRGGRKKRPSTVGPIFSSMLEDLPDVPPIEKTLHIRKVRSLPAAKKTLSTSVWSSIETIAPSHSAAVGPSESGDASPPQLNEPEESSAITPFIQSPQLSSMPSPAMYVECGSSGSSTPHTPRGGLSVCGTPRGNTPSGTTTMRKQLAHQLDGGPASKRRLISSPSSSPTLGRGRGLLDAEIASLLNYGSEEEMEDEEDVENEQPLFVIPRTARMYLEDEEEEHLPSNNTTISLVTSTMLEEGQMQYHSRINRWHDTTADELAVYFAIIMATGIIVKSRLEEYWNSTADIFQTPGFSAAMGINRFLILSKCLHFNNNSLCNPNTMSRAEAKLFKIKPILDHLNCKFSTLYRLDRNIALDESLTMWKGWLDINQFIRNKAASIGIKTYEVCESLSGYLWRFEVHAGQEPSGTEMESPISGKVASLVLRLLNGLEHKGYTVWMDNYYNSPALARELKCRGFDCVGTLRTDRQFVPSELTNLSKRDMTVGQVCGCTSGDVDLIVWRDKNRVAFVSTYHGIVTTTCGDTLKPSVVPDYNVCMGGVDRKDQMISMYPIERRRNRVWYKKLFRRLLNVSVLNAYILFKNNNLISHRNFRRSLVTELLARHGRAGPSARPRALLNHHPAQYDYLSDSKHERHRRGCTVCKKRTNTFCNGCNKTLCVFTCFGPYHDALVSRRSY